VKQLSPKVFFYGRDQLSIFDNTGLSLVTSIDPFFFSVCDQLVDVQVSQNVVAVGWGAINDVAKDFPFLGLRRVFSME